MARHLQAGFTLVELMVVLLLLGLLSAAVVLSLPPTSGALLAETGLLAARLEGVARTAVLTGETRGVVFDDAGYTLQRLHAGRWSSAGAEHRPWSAVPGLAFEEGGPMLRFDAAGIATPFRLLLERDGERVRLIGDDDGRVRLETGDA